MKFPGVLLIAIALVSPPVAAQTTSAPNDRASAKQQQVERAKARCKVNHGADCDTPEGLKEWELQERTRQEAIRDGSHRRRATQPGPTQ